MLSVDDYKLIAVLTLLVFLLFGGGSIAMTYLAKRKNTPPPTVSPIPITLSPTPTNLPHPSPTATKRTNYAP